MLENLKMSDKTPFLIEVNEEWRALNTDIFWKRSAKSLENFQIRNNKFILDVNKWHQVNLENYLHLITYLLHYKSLEQNLLPLLS